MTAHSPGHQAWALSGAKVELRSEADNDVTDAEVLKGLVFGVQLLLICGLLFFRSEFSLLAWQILVIEKHRIILKTIERNNREDSGG